MNVSLSIIDNMLAGTAGAVGASLKPDKVQRAPQSTLGADGKSSQVGNSEATTKTDNSLIKAQDKAADKPAGNFGRTLRETVVAKTPQKAQNNAQPQKQVLNQGEAQKANLAQPLLAQESPIFTILTVKEAGTEVPVKPNKPKTPGEPADLSATHKGHKSAAVLAQSLGPVAQAAKKPGNLTPSAHKTNYESKVSTAAEVQAKKYKAFVPDVVKKPLTPGTPLKEGEKTGSTPVLNKAVFDTGHSAVSGSAKELVTPPGANGSRATVANPKIATATAGEKQIVAGTLATAEHQEKPVLSDEELAPGTFARDAGKTTVVGEKMPVISTSIPVVQAKSHEAKSQPVMPEPQKTVPNVGKPAESKAGVSQTLGEFSGGQRKESSDGGTHLSDEPTAQKLTAAQIQMSTIETKDRGSSTSSQTRSNPKQILSHSNSQIEPVEQSQTSVTSSKTANSLGQPAAGDGPADIGKQILESIQSSLLRQSGDRQITVRLNPPELGKVLIRFQEQDSQLTGLLEVSKAQTRFEIEQALPQIIRNLAACGVQMRRLEVVLSDEAQSQQQTLKDQLLQNGWGQQQNSANPGTSGDEADSNGVDKSSADYSSYQSISELNGALITDGSINMLM